MAAGHDAERHADQQRDGDGHDHQRHGLGRLEPHAEDPDGGEATDADEGHSTGGPVRDEGRGDEDAGPTEEVEDVLRPADERLQQVGDRLQDRENTQLVDR
jgi:hypothetical protein